MRGRKGEVITPSFSLREDVLWWTSTNRESGGFVGYWAPVTVVCVGRLYLSKLQLYLGSEVCSKGTRHRPRRAFFTVVPSITLITVDLVYRVAENGSAAAVITGLTVTGGFRQAVVGAVPACNVCL